MLCSGNVAGEGSITLSENPMIPGEYAQQYNALIEHECTVLQKLIIVISHRQTPEIVSVKTSDGYHVPPLVLF